MKKQRWVLLLTIILLTAAQLAVASTSNKWRLEFSGGADSDGTIEKRRGNSNFGVEVVSNLVKGVRINIDRE